ncbi:unnamed protein product, partial [Staurois parvus]
MPLIRSDLLLLTWRVTRRFSACSLVPYRPLHYRLGLSDYAPAQPSIHPSHRAHPTSSHLALPGWNPWRTPLPLTGVLSRGDLVSGYYKSIPTIRGPGEQVPRGLDSALWARLTSGVLVVPLGGPS